MSVVNIYKPDADLVQFLEITLEAVKDGTITSFMGVYIYSSGAGDDFYIADGDQKQILHSQLMLSLREYEDFALREIEFDE